MENVWERGLAYQELFRILAKALSQYANLDVEYNKVRVDELNDRIKWLSDGLFNTTDEVGSCYDRDLSKTSPCNKLIETLSCVASFCSILYDFDHVRDIRNMHNGDLHHDYKHDCPEFPMEEFVETGTLTKKLLTDPHFIAVITYLNRVLAIPPRSQLTKTVVKHIILDIHAIENNIPPMNYVEPRASRNVYYNELKQRFPRPKWMDLPLENLECKYLPGKFPETPKHTRLKRDLNGNKKDKSRADEVPLPPSFPQRSGRGQFDTPAKRAIAVDSIYKAFNRARITKYPKRSDRCRYCKNMPYKCSLSNCKGGQKKPAKSDLAIPSKKSKDNQTGSLNHSPHHRSAVTPTGIFRRSGLNLRRLQSLAVTFTSSTTTPPHRLSTGLLEAKQTQQTLSNQTNPLVAENTQSTHSTARLEAPLTAAEQDEPTSVANELPEVDPVPSEASSVESSIIDEPSEADRLMRLSDLRISATDYHSEEDATDGQLRSLPGLPNQRPQGLDRETKIEHDKELPPLFSVPVPTWAVRPKESPTPRPSFEQTLAEFFANDVPIGGDAPVQSQDSKEYIQDIQEARRAEREAQRAREREEELARNGGLRAPNQLFIQQLSEDSIQRIQNTLHASPTTNLATTGQGVELRRHEFAKVVPPTEWLNDEIVNGSLHWLDTAINTAAGIKNVRLQTRKCASFSSYFFKMLRDRGAKSGVRTAKREGITKDNILQVDTLLFPICEASHWTLLVIRPSKKTVAHMDSLNPRGNESFIKLGYEFLREIMGNDFVEKEWKTVKHKAPRQVNGWDCGVHTITNAMCLALGLHPIDSYLASDMPMQRLRLAGMLLNRGFNGDYDLSAF